VFFSSTSPVISLIEKPIPQRQRCFDIAEDFYQIDRKVTENLGTNMRFDLTPFYLVGIIWRFQTRLLYNPVY